jgi:hypothetical protein
MLTYTERMREISRFRHDSAAYLSGKSLSSSNQEPSVDPTQDRHHAVKPQAPTALGKGGRSSQHQQQLQQQSHQHRRQQQRRPTSLDDNKIRPAVKKNPADPTSLVNGPKQRLRPLSDLPPSVLAEPAQQAAQAAQAAQAKAAGLAPVKEAFVETDTSASKPKRNRDPKSIHINFVRFVF